MRGSVGRLVQHVPREYGNPHDARDGGGCDRSHLDSFGIGSHVTHVTAFDDFLIDNCGGYGISLRRLGTASKGLPHVRGIWNSA